MGHLPLNVFMESDSVNCRAKEKDLPNEIIFPNARANLAHGSPFPVKALRVVQESMNKFPTMNLGLLVVGSITKSSRIRTTASCGSLYADLTFYFRLTHVN